MGEKNSNVLEMMLQKKESERKELQHENEVLQKRLKEYEAAYVLSQQAKEDLAKELFQAEDKIDQLQDFIDKGGHTESLDELKEKYFDLEKRHENLIEQTKDDEATNNELMEQLKETQKLSSGKDKVINDLNQQLAKHNALIIVHQKEEKRMSNLLAENETVISNITREKNSLDAEVVKVAAEVEKLNAQLGSNMANAKEKGEALDRIREQTSALIEEKKAHCEEIKNLKKDLIQAKTENEDCQVEYEMLQEEFERCKEIIEGIKM